MVKIFRERKSAGAASIAWICIKAVTDRQAPRGRLGPKPKQRRRQTFSSSHFRYFRRHSPPQHPTQLSFFTLNPFHKPFGLSTFSKDTSPVPQSGIQKLPFQRHKPHSLMVTPQHPLPPPPHPDNSVMRGEKRNLKKTFRCKSKTIQNLCRKKNRRQAVHFWQNKSK